MDTKSIQEAVRKRPFQSFTLRMNDGREFYIPHPEFVAVSRRVVMVIDAVSEAGVYLEPILIASMRYDGDQSLPPSMPQNGPLPKNPNDQ